MISSLNIPQKQLLESFNMNKVSIDIENCYGIKKLKYDFDFTERKIYVIYAPNGVMKTSFTQTFQDLSEDKPSQDRIFKERINKRVINDDGGI